MTPSLKLTSFGALFMAIASLVMLSWSSRTLADQEYTVVAGDTACEIAQKFSVPCKSIIDLNKLGDDGLIVVGQRLQIPVPPRATPKNVVAEPAPITSPTEPPAIPDTEELSPAPDLKATQKNLSSSKSGKRADLWDVFTEARANDPIFAAQRTQHNAAAQAIPQARATLRPQLTFGSDLTRTYDDNFEDSDALRTSISATQSLYNSPASITLDQAKYRVSVADANYRASQQDLILRVAKAYFSALSMADNLILSEKNQELVGKQLILASERLNAGIGTQTDLFDAEAMYEGAIADGIEATKLLDDAKQALALLTGNETGPLLKLESVTSLDQPLPNNPEAWVEAALTNNFKLLAERHNLSISRLEAEKKRAARFPTLGASLTTSFTDTEQKNTTQTSLTLRLSVPLLKGGLMRSQIKEADLNLEAAYSNFEASRREVQIKTRGIFLSINSRLRRIEALAGAVRSKQSALLAKEDGLAAGINTTTEVLDGRRDLFLAQFNHLKERYDLIIETLELEALVGDLTEEDILRVSGRLE